MIGAFGWSRKLLLLQSVCIFTGALCSYWIRTVPYRIDASQESVMSWMMTVRFIVMALAIVFSTITLILVVVERRAAKAATKAKPSGLSLCLYLASLLATLVLAVVWVVQPQFHSLKPDLAKIEKKATLFNQDNVTPPTTNKPFTREE